MKNAQKFTVLAVAVLLVALALVTAARHATAYDQLDPNLIIGSWAWSFSQSPNTSAPVMRHGTATFTGDRKMTWKEGRNECSGTWEGPYVIGVLLRWKEGPPSGSIDLLELRNNGAQLTGHNKDDLEVRGDLIRGRRDSLFNTTWTWSFGPAGNVVKNGTVDFKSDDAMHWTSDGGSGGGGTWEQKPRGVLLRWKTGPCSDSIDILGLVEADTKLTGLNAKGWSVEAKKQ